MIPGRLGQIEWFDGRELAVYTSRPRLFEKLWAIPGVRRHQTGDTEMRAVFPVEAIKQVATVIGAKRWGGAGRGRPENFSPKPGQMATSPLQETSFDVEQGVRAWDRDSTRKSGAAVTAVVVVPAAGQNRRENRRDNDCRRRDRDRPRSGPTHPSAALLQRRAVPSLPPPGALARRLSCSPRARGNAHRPPSRSYDLVITWPLVVALEIDRRTPRRESVRKLRRIDGVRLIVLSQPSQRPLRCPRGVDAVLGAWPHAWAARRPCRRG